MGTANTLTLTDIFGIPKKREEQAVRALDVFVRERIEGNRAKTIVETHDRIDDQVDRALAREIKHLATKDDLKTEMLAMRKDMDGKFQAMYYWIAGILATMLVGFIATLFAVLLTRTDNSRPVHYPPETMRQTDR